MDSFMVKEIESLENNKKEEINIDEEESHKENSENSILEIDDGKDKIENKNKTKKINKICPTKYQFLEELNKLQVEKEKQESFDNFFEIEEYDDPIIYSTIDDFVKLLNDIKLNYCTSSNISIEDSLYLHSDGKKRNILKTDNHSGKIENIIKNINKIAKGDESENEQILYLNEKIKYQIKTNLECLYCITNNILKNLENLWFKFNIGELFLKYKIKSPLNPLKYIYQLDNQEDTDNNEEIYFLTLVLGYLFLKPKLKQIQKLNNAFQQIDLNEITRNNILKRDIIKKLKENISDFNMSSLISNVWKKFGKNEVFVEDKKMNDLMWNYINNKTEEDFKKDLINLIKPYYNGIDLNSLDHQNISVEPFHLFD